MATYGGEKGFTIPTIAGDPPAPTLGQIWYNTTSNVLKGYVTTTAGWSSATAFPTGTSDMGSGGTTTAAIIWGGTPFDNVGNDTWEYDGTSWTAGGTMTTILGGNAGTGTQTAAIGAGGHNGAGYQSDTAMEYNGSSWTAITADPASNAAIRGTAGIQTAFLTVGGYYPTQTNVTSLWDGSAWTTGGVYPVSKTAIKANGTQAACFAAGGNPGFIGTSNTFDGSTWTATGSLNVARAYGGTGGSVTVGIYFAGNTPSISTTVNISETYDGTSWTVAPTMATGRNSPAQGWGVGSADLGVLCFGGNLAPGYSTAVEEWDAGGDSVVTLTSS